MKTKYSNLEISEEAVVWNMSRLINQVYKLLPSREENGDWIKLLDNIIVEITGLSSIFTSQLDDKKLLLILTKLEGLKFLQDKEDFQTFRRVIFDCLTLMGEVKANVRI